MKKLALILFLLSFSLATQAQLMPWASFPVDAKVTLLVPGKPQSVDASRYEPTLAPSQVRGYRYTDAAGTYILMRLEKPMDRLYAVDSNPTFYNQQVDDMLRAMHGSLLQEAIVMNGPYQGRCVRYNISGKGTQYMGALLVHGVSYQFQYLPSKPLTDGQDRNMWAQFLRSVASVR